MCDSIANGGYRPPSTSGGCCPPANVIIASNVLNTDGNVIAGNIIAVDGTFTGNLYVSGNIISGASFWGVNISAGAVNTLVVGNNLLGNTSGAITDAGTTTSDVNNIKV